jgi:hypothetical protein
MKTKARVFTFSLLALAALAVSGCRERTDRSEGSVLLSVSDFDRLPIQVSTLEGPYQVGQVTLRNVPKNPTGTTSDLQDIEMRSYEVTFARLDSGTRQIPPLVEPLFGIVPVGGTTEYENLPFLRPSQVANPPLSDLSRFGKDQQTNSQVIPVRVTMRFFGRTLAGDDIVSEPASFNVDVLP